MISSSGRCCTTNRWIPIQAGDRSRQPWQCTGIGQVDASDPFRVGIGQDVIASSRRELVVPRNARRRPVGGPVPNPPSSLSGYRR
jgi:hypothetical protein